MFKKINPKPLTIKEYTKNYKFPEKAKISLEDEYLHRTQNNFLSNIIKKKLKKNKEIKIQKDEDLNKTIEKVFRIEENRIRILNILKRRNHKISLTSDRLTISKSNTRDISHDSIYEKIKGQKSFDFHTPIKKYNKLNILIKKRADKPLTPLLQDKKGKNEEQNKNNIKQNKNSNIMSNNDIISNNDTLKKFKNKKSETIHSSFHLKTEPNTNKYNKNTNKANKNNKTEKINKNNKEKLNKTQRNSKKTVKKNINLKIEKISQIILLKKIKNFPKNYTQEKCEEIQIINFNEDEESKYSGYILIKKNMGKTIKKIKLDKNENNIKEILINIINEITGEQNDMITKNELSVLNKYKEENEIKDKKIKEMESLFEEEKKSYLNLKNELDKLTLENKNLQEKINTLESKENELNNINTSFTEYKKHSEEEIQNMEFLIKQYENQLNQIKKEKNEVKKYNIEKQKELIIEKSETKKIDTNSINNIDINEENIKKEKDEKISRALNRIRKKKLMENNNEQNAIKKSDKINQIRKMLEQKIKRESINHEKNNEEKNNEEKNNEEKIEDKKNKEINFLNLFDGKPINKNKKKPSIKFDFIE